MRARWTVIFGVVAGGIGYAASLLVGELQRLMNSQIAGRELVALRWLLILVFVVLGALIGLTEDCKEDDRG